MREHRLSSGVTSVNASARAASTGGRTIVGYAAVFYDGTTATEYMLAPGVVERIMPKAFDRALREKQDVRALFNHDASAVLGRTAAGTLKLAVDSTGLRYEITMPESRRDVYEAVQRGDVGGASFSFTAIAETWRDIGGGRVVRELHDVDLGDVGPVTFPAYSGTTASVRNLLRLPDYVTARLRAMEVFHHACA